MSRASVVLCAALALLGAGCGERSGDAVAKRALQPSWDAAADPFVVPGWKSGDKASWQEHETQRAQNQNEYLRVH
jgi:hypothetical protein